MTRKSAPSAVQRRIDTKALSKWCKFLNSEWEEGTKTPTIKKSIKIQSKKGSTFSTANISPAERMDRI